MAPLEQPSKPSATFAVEGNIAVVVVGASVAGVIRLLPTSSLLFCNYSD